MQKLVWQNSNGDVIDLTSGHYGITNWEGFSNADLNIQSQQVPFQDGGVFLDALIDQRELAVTLAIYDGNNLENRYKYRRELIHALNPKLGEGYLIYTNDFISKRIKCVAQIPLFETHNSNDSGTPKASLAWTACEPYWEDVEETEVTFNETEQPTIENKGDIPAQLKINFLTNNVTNPQITRVSDSKTIKYNGVLNTDLEINTEMGNKYAKTGKFDFDLENFGLDITNIIYVEEKEMFIISFFSDLCWSKDGLKWDYCDVPSQTAIRDICYSENRKVFIAVGYEGLILTSLDGKEWQLRNSGKTYNLGGVCYSAHLDTFIAVGDDNGDKGVIVKSSDCITWTETYYNDYNYFYDIVYSEHFHKFIIVANPASDYDRILTSEDGITLNTSYQSEGFISQRLFYDDINNTCFCGNIKSNDLINWVILNVIISSNMVYSEVLKKYYSFVNNNVYISSDSNNWNSEVTNLNFNKVAYSKVLGKFVGVQNYGVIRESYDGINWNKTKDGVRENLYKIAVANDKHIILINGNGIVLKTEDVKNYKTLSLSFTDIIYVSKYKRFFAVSGYSISSSIDGENWITVSHITDKNLYCIIYENDKFIVGGNEIVITSVDGINWIIASESIGVISKIIYGNNRYVAFDTRFNTFTKIYISTDCENWSEQNCIANDLAYNNITKIFYKVGNEGIVSITNDLTYWKPIESFTDNDIQHINYIKDYGLLVACVASEIYYTYDGINWIEKKVGTRMQDITNCIFLNSLIMVGWYGYIYNINELFNLNVIQNISPNSDMNFNLLVGLNQLRLNWDNGDFKCKIRFRQKYIGV